MNFGSMWRLQTNCHKLVHLILERLCYCFGKKNMNVKRDKTKTKINNQHREQQHSNHLFPVWETKTEFNKILKYYCKNTVGIEQRVVSVIPLVGVLIIVVVVIVIVVIN